MNAAGIEALRALVAELRAGQETVSPERVGRVLECAGEGLRFGAEHQAPPPEAEAALRLLSSSAVEAWALALSAGLPELEARLRRATEEAVEAAISEIPGDADTWAAWAKEGLCARDRLESQQVALAWREALGFSRDRGLRERLTRALEAQDRALRPRSRWLVGLNPWRRQQRDALSPRYREQAWWFSERAGCDDLLRWLSGEPVQGAHLDECAECRRDLRSVEVADAPRPRHLSGDELWNLDLGLLSLQERAVIDAHLRTCAECTRAVAALEDGEEAIREVNRTLEKGGATVIPLAGWKQPRTDRALLEEPEVLAEDADFRLLLFRRRARPRLVVQPRGPARVVAAAVFVPGEPARALTARPGPEGLEVELAEALCARGGATVRVRMSGAAKDCELDVSFPASRG